MAPTTLESKKKCLKVAFTQFILANSEQEAHWYAFNVDLDGPNSGHSLNNLLGGYDPEDYYALLFALDFRKTSKSGYVYDLSQFTSFCQELRLNNHCDFNEYSPTNEKKRLRAVFIRTGKFKSEHTTFMPKEQLKRMIKAPCPRLLKNLAPQQTFLQSWKVYKGIEFDVVTPKPLFDVDTLRTRTRSKKNYGNGLLDQPKNFAKKVSPDKAITHLESTNTSHDITTVLNIISLNLFNKICDPAVVAAMDVSNIFSKGLSMEEVMDSLALTMMEVENEKAAAQLKRAEALQFATNARVLSLHPKNYPFLSHKQINVTCSHQVQCMLRDVVRMKQDEDDILKFAQHNSKPTTLVRVPYSSNTTMFHKNLKRVKGQKDFVDEVLHAMLPPEKKVSVSDIANEEMVGGGPEDDARWTGIEHAAEALIVSLSKKFPAAFVSAGDKVGMPVMMERKKMSPATTAAMLDDAAMTQNSLSVLRKYHIKEYGWWFGAPSSKVKELSSDVVPPNVEVATVADQDINYWWKNPREVILKKLKRMMNKNDQRIVWNNLDIVLGGDHGQGSFRMSAKVILRQNRKKVKKFEVGLGDVECQTDSYSILKATLSEPINSSLKEIINYERDDDGKIKKDGSLKTIKKTGLNGTSIDMYYSFKHTPLEGDEELVVERPLRLFISGDLAFYSMVLGMKGSETNACWLCLLKKVSQWEKDPFEKGEERTMKWILSNFEKAAEKQERIHGLIEKPLFDAVEVCHYIVPPLHTMLGIANTILTDFKSFVEFSVEKAPLELRMARVFHTKGEVGWKEAKKALNDFDVINGPQLGSLHRNMMDGSEHLEYLLDFDGMASDIDETEQEIVAISLEIESINAARTLLVEALNVASKTWPPL